MRLHWLLDEHTFKLFVGLLLFGLAISLFRKQRYSEKNAVSCIAVDRANNWLPIIVTAFVIGIIGGAYGIGGGSFMAPVLLAAFNFSLQRVAGAALFGTLVTSIVGVALYQFLPSPQGIETRPDWALGALFGLGEVLWACIWGQGHRSMCHGGYSNSVLE